MCWTEYICYPFLSVFYLLDISYDQLALYYIIQTIQAFISSLFNSKLYNIFYALYLVLKSANLKTNQNSAIHHFCISDDMPQNYRRPPSPPPSYEEVSKASMLNNPDKANDRTKAANNSSSSSCQKLSKIEEEKRVNHDELPPEYATAVAMTPAVNSQLLSSNISQPL